jgi:hypothetical protein
MNNDFDFSGEEILGSLWRRLGFWWVAILIIPFIVILCSLGTKLSSQRSTPKDYIQESCDLWLKLRANPANYVGQEVAVKLKADHVMSWAWQFRSRVNNAKFTIRYNIYLFNIHEGDLVRVRGKFLGLGDDGAVCIEATELINEGFMK